MSTLPPAPVDVGGAGIPVTRRVLLACGIGYGVVYVVSNDLVAAGAYPGTAAGTRWSASCRRSLRRPGRS